MQPICLLLYPTLTIAAVTLASSALAFRWMRQTQQKEDFDGSVRLIVVLLIVAGLSMGVFLSYIFVHLQAC